MAKRDRVKDRLEFYLRDVWACRGCPERWRTAIMDPGSLKRAAEYFDLNHEGTADLIALAHILADVVFGKPERGRPKDGGDRLLKLGLHLHYLQQRVGRLDDTAAAKALVETRDYKAQQWESLRKKLPAARRQLERVRGMFTRPLDEWAPIFLSDK